MLNGAGEQTFNLYYHWIVFDPDETTGKIGAAKAIDMRGAIANDQAFLQTLSVRLPTVARFKTSDPDDE